MRIIAFQPPCRIRSVAAMPRNSWNFLLLCALLLACGLPVAAQVQLVPTIRTVAGAGNYCSGSAVAATMLNSPQGLALDALGNLYIAVSGNNVICKLTPAGVISTVAGTGAPGSAGNGTTATSAQLSSPIGVAVDGAGNIFIADSGNNVVREVASSSGNMAALTATVGVVSNPQGLAVDASGNLYIADAGNNVVRKILASNGSMAIVAGNGSPGYSGDNNPATGTNAELNAPVGVAVDGSGNIYISDTGNNAIREVVASSGNIVTLPSIPGGTLNKPQGVAIDALGNLYIADAGNNVVREVTATGLITVAGNGTAAYTGDNGPATGAALKAPAAMAVDASGNLFIADNGNNAVRAANPVFASVTANSVSFPATAIAANSATVNVYVQATANETLTSVIVPLSQGGKQEFTVGAISGSGCPTLPGFINAGIICTVPITFSPAYPGQRMVPLQVVTSNGGVNTTTSFGLIGTGTGPMVGLAPAVISTLAGGGSNAGLSYSGAATGVQLSSPMGVAVDASANLYIADTVNNAIRKVDKNGIINTVTFSSGSSFCSGGGVNSPHGGALDAAGNLYFANTNSRVICKVDANGIGAIVAGTGGTTGYTGDNGAATIATLTYPTGVALDASGDLYIADHDNNVIRKVSPNGIITTVAGNGSNASPSYTGPASGVKLSAPFGVTVDASGNLYIADGGNGVIRKVNPSGIVSTVAGGGTNTGSNYSGAATGAAISPFSVSVDVSGNLYIVDAKVIRKVDSSGNMTTVAGGGSNAGASYTGAATGATLSAPQNLALDASGNFYIADTGNNIVRMVKVGAAPALSFANTAATQISSDSPQTVVVQNIGNAALNFSAVSYPMDFPEGSGVAGDCTAVTALLTGGNCTLTIDFEPQSGAPLSESVGITDNALNAAPATQSVTVSGTGLTAAATLGLSASPAGPSVNTTITFTATLTSPPLTLAPTGTVAFTATGSGAPISLCAAAAVNSSGVAQCPISTLLPGSYTVSATYSGDKYYLVAAPATMTQAVTAQAVTLGVSSPGASAVNTSVTFTAQLAGVLKPIIPAGTVSFTVNGSAIGDCPAVTVSTAGSATCTTSKLVAPSDAIVATYTGDPNFTVAAQASMTQNVSSLAATLGITPSPSSSTNVNDTVTFTAQLSGVAMTPVAPAGNVAFTANGNTITGCGAVKVDATGKAGCPTTTLAAGQDPIKATYSGDLNFTVATPASMTQTVAKAAVSNTLTASGGGSVDQPATFTDTIALVSGSLNVGFNGAVTFKDTTTGANLTGCTNPASVTLGAGATTSVQVQCATSALAAGSHTITANYSDSNYAQQAQGSIAGSINPTFTQTVVTSSLASATVDQAVTFTATVSPTSGGTTYPITVPMTGTVSFAANGTTIAGCSAVAFTTTTSGLAKCTTAALPASASNSIVATYVGDANYGASTNSASPFLQNVIQVGTSTALATSPVTWTVGQSLTLNATVTTTGNLAINVPFSGNVTFVDGSTTLSGCGAVSVTTGTTAGTASCTLTTLTAGSHSFQATFNSGDPNYATSASKILTQSAGTSATTTSISAPATSTVDVPVTITVTVAPSPAGPVTVPFLGTVSISDSLGAVTCGGGIAFNGSTGVAICNATALIAGTHLLNATYTANSSGDNYTGSATATAASIKVSPANSSVAVASSSVNNASVVDNAVTFTATVGTPTGATVSLSGGQVSFTDNNVAISSCQALTITAGLSATATCTTSALAAGTHTVAASYSKDPNYNSSSGATGQTVAAVTPQISLSTTPATSAAINQPVIITAAVTPFNSPVLLTGTVAFYDSTSGSNQPISGCVVTWSAATGVASCTTSQLAFGAHTLKAIYSGDNSYSSVTAIQAITVGQAGTTLAVTTSGTPSLVNAPVTFKATVTENPVGSTALSGTVAFTDSLGGAAATTISGCAAVAVVPATGVATCVTSALLQGSHTITATYSNDPNFTGNSNTVAQVVNVQSSALTVATLSTNNASTVDVPVTLVATVAPASGSASVAYSGSVTFSDSVGAITGCTAAVAVNSTTGVASCLATALLAGTHSITAKYSSDTNYANSTATAVAVKIAQANSSIAVVSSSTPAGTPPTPTSIVNNPVTFTATVSTPSGATVPLSTGSTVTVAFADNGNTIAACAAQPTTLSGAGFTSTATCTTTALIGGSHAIVATYSGDANYTGNNSSVAQTVNRNTSTTTVTAPANNASANVNQLVTLTATVLPTGSSALVPTGTVTFTDSVSGAAVALGGACAFPATLSAAAGGGYQATCTTNAPVSGSNQIVATYSGDNNYTSSSNAASPVTLSVLAATASTTLVAISTNTWIVDQPQVLTANVTITSPVAGNPPLSGTVTFTATVNGQPQTLCSSAVAVVNSSTASVNCTTSSLLAGVNSLTATYSKDPNYTSSNTGNLSQTVAQAASTVTMISSLNPSYANNYVAKATFTATITPYSVPVNPTGTVTFVDSLVGAAVCTAVTLNNGVATCTPTSLPPGPNAITATYNGDANFTTNKASLAQSVQDFTLSFGGSYKQAGSSFTMAAPVTRGFTSSTDPFTPQTISLTPSSIQGFATAAGKPLNLTCTVTAGTAGAGATMPICTLPNPTLAVAGAGTQASVGVIIDASNSSITPGTFSVAVSGVDPTTGLVHAAASFTVAVRAVTALTVITGATTGNTANVTFVLPAGVGLTLPNSCTWLAGTGIGSVETVPPATFNMACSFSPTSIPSSTSVQSATVTVTISTSGTNAAAAGASGGLLLALGIPLFGLLGLVRGRRSLRQAMLRMLGLAILSVAAIQAIGCSGSFTQTTAPVVGQTPPGNYYLLIQGTGSDGNTYDSVLQVNVTL